MQHALYNLVETRSHPLLPVRIGANKTAATCFKAAVSLSAVATPPLPPPPLLSLVHRLHGLHYSCATAAFTRKYTRKGGRTEI